MPPQVLVNCALTLDGCMGGPGRTPLKISNDEDLRRVHGLRASVDAILVGAGTVVADDPKLTVKWDLAGRAPGKAPLRIVVDPRLRAPSSALIFNEAAPTLSFASHSATPSDRRRVERVDSGPDGLDLGQVLDRLTGLGVHRLMVEGGPRTLWRFFDQRLVDEATLFIAGRTAGITDAPRFLERPMDLAHTMALVDVSRLGDGILARWRRR